MPNLIVYDTIEEKNKIETQSFRKLTGLESLVQTLNVMDFMAVLKRDRAETEDNINWIVLDLQK